MKQLKHKGGFSLIEVLVSTALFVIIMVSTMDIFRMVINSQRSAIATQNVEESLKYFLEMTGKEVRMAKRNNGLCLMPSDAIYKIDSNSFGDTLTFRNYHDQCVTYSLQTDASGVRRFIIYRDSSVGFVTPGKINISELNFVLKPETATNQPTVTMEIVAYALGKEMSKSQMRIQTTLTSRYYKKN